MEEDKKKNLDNPASKINPHRISDDEKRDNQRKKFEEDKENERRNNIQIAMQEAADKETHSA